MKPFNKGKKFGKGSGGNRERKGFGRPRSGGFGGGGFGGGFDGGHDRQPSHSVGGGLYTAICADCGQECEVPFKPTGNKPVYCRSCFKHNESLGGAGAAGHADHFDRGPRQRERGGFRNNRRGPAHGGTGGGAASGPSTELLNEINRKLDKIIEALDIEE